MFTFSPETLELTRRGLPVRVGLEDVLRPVLYRVPVAVETRSTVSAVGFREGQQELTSPGHVLKLPERVVSAPVIHDKKTRQSAPIMTLYYGIPLFNELFDVLGFVIGRCYKV